ncbi:MAG: hypothetical protein ACSW8G_02525 [Bacillota bacterium]
MTTFELVNRYNLEDRRIESVAHDGEQKTLTLGVSGPLSLVFEGISDLAMKTYVEYSGLLITEVLEDYGRVSFSLYDDISNDYYEISFRAEGVDVKE